MKTAYLILETGEVFPGQLVGEDTPIYGEIVFNTSMTGYQEIMTDPSYAGQIVVFSYPLIGNYGINLDNNESSSVHVSGIITSEICSEPSHYQLKETAIETVNKYNIPCLTNVDTRSLVQTIRKRGTVNAMITEQQEVQLAFSKELSLVDRVACQEVITYENPGPHIVLLDFGYKKSILHFLCESNCKVSIVPYFYSFEQISALSPDGIVISNGPGDPMVLADELNKIRLLTESYPTIGICLGHQLIALSYGAQTKKLPFGHRGANHPVKDLMTGKVFITSQNHGYVVVDDSIDESQFFVSFKHVNDGTIEGLKHSKLPIRTGQFHPEAHPGPQDTEFIFYEFFKQVNNHLGVMKNAVV